MDVTLYQRYILLLLQSVVYHWLVFVRDHIDFIGEQIVPKATSLEEIQGETTVENILTPGKSLDRGLRIFQRTLWCVQRIHIGSNCISTAISHL